MSRASTPTVALGLSLVIAQASLATIDRRVDSSLTFAIHVNAAGMLSEEQLGIIAEKATRLLQSSQDASDISCCYLLSAQSLTTFGSPGDGLDIIESQAELDALGNGAYIVLDLQFCGGSINPGIAGCATLGDLNGLLAIDLDALNLGTPNDLARMGSILAHERGHNHGLSHREPSPNLMTAVLTAGEVGRINASECNAFRGPWSPSGSCSCMGSSVGSPPEPDGTPCTDFPGNGTCADSGLCFSLPDNDSCATPQPIDDGQSLTADMEGALVDGASTCESVPDEDVWFDYTAWCTGTLDINACGSDFNPTLSSHSSCPGSPGNETSCTAFCQLQHPASRGSQHLIRIADGTNGGPDYPWPPRNYDLTASCLPDMTDSDLDGVWDWVESLIGTDPASSDTDGDLADDTLELPLLTTRAAIDGYLIDPLLAFDRDSDGLQDAIDPDDDGDGIPTALEDANGNGDAGDDDLDLDGTADFRDVWMGADGVRGGASLDDLPSIGTDGAGTWIVAWSDIDAANGDRDVFFARSNDDGQTWSAPSSVNSNAGTDLGDDRHPFVLTDNAGSWMIAWTSDDDLGGTVGVDFDILGSWSIDGGATWGQVFAIDSGAATDAGDDQAPAGLVDSSGRWVLAWASDSGATSLGADEDILFSSAPTAQGAWQTGQALNQGASTDSGDDRQPVLLEDLSGGWLAVWASDGPAGADYDLFASRSTDAGASWSQPVLVNDGGLNDLGDDVEPTAQALAPGGEVLIAWESDESAGSIGADLDILTSSSSDDGATWSTAKVINRRATIDLADDLKPRLAFGGAKALVALWSSDETVGGGFGADYDVFLATSRNLGSSWMAASDPLNTGAAGDRSDDIGIAVGADGMGGWVLSWLRDPSVAVMSDSQIISSTGYFSTCGNGFTNGVEQCDDGNLAAGDCCSASCQIETGACAMAPKSVTDTILPGSSLSSDIEFDGATPSDPLEVEVTSPSGGAVTIVRTPTTGVPPEGFGWFGQQVELTAPDETVSDPLVIVFLADASLAGSPPIDLFKDGALVAACDASPPRPSGHAIPDPCVESTVVLGNGDVELTVLSSTGSTWNLGTEACGDAALGPGEQCDDGNTADGDCCSATCQFQAAGQGAPDCCVAGVCNTTTACGAVCFGQGTCQLGGVTGDKCQCLP